MFKEFCTSRSKVQRNTLQYEQGNSLNPKPSHRSTRNMQLVLWLCSDLLSYKRSAIRLQVCLWRVLRRRALSEAFGWKEGLKVSAEQF